MTDRELKRLSRTELLQLLLDQVQENETLKAKMDTLENQLDRHRITCEKAGSIAEAALAITNIFQEADQAARNYLQEVEERAARQEEQARERANKLVSDATDSADMIREEAEAILANAHKAAAGIREDAEAHLANAKKQAEELLEQAKQESDEYWNKVNAQIKALLEGQDTLKELFLSRGK